MTVGSSTHNKDSKGLFKPLCTIFVVPDKKAPTLLLAWRHVLFVTDCLEFRTLSYEIHICRQVTMHKQVW